MNDIVEMGVTMNGTKISLLKYADDLVLISTWVLVGDTLSTENCKILYNMRFFIKLYTQPKISSHTSCS